MIQKLSNFDNMGWVEGSKPVQRTSVNQSALSAFTNILVKKAKEMQTKGVTLEKVAASFNLSVDSLKNILAQAEECKDCEREVPVTKIASKQETSKDAAQEAYDDMYGKKKVLAGEIATAGKKVFTATGKGDAVTNTGGPRKQMKMESSNTIWDSEVIDRAMKTPDNGEKIRAAQTKEEARRQEMSKTSRDQTIDEEIKEILNEK